MIGAEANARGPVPLHHEREAPLSYAQERFWLLERLAPDVHALFNIPLVLPLSVHCDASLLRRCLGQIMRRHEILRTRIVVTRAGVMQVVDPPGEPPFELLDIGHFPRELRTAEAWRWAALEAERPFDLEAAPPFRVRLLRIADQDHLLVAVFHHIAFDGWSAGVFHRELLTMYTALAAGRPPELPELRIQYADHALRERQTLEGEQRRGPLLHYWTERLRGLRRRDLPPDRPRPPRATHRAGRCERVLPHAVVAALGRLCRRESITPFMALLTALAVVVQRWNRGDDVAIATSEAGRTRSELEPLIGCFLNTLVMRIDLSGDPRVGELIRHVRDTALGAYAHRDLPIELLLRELHPGGRGADNPLFQVYLNYLALGEADPVAVGPPAEMADGTSHSPFEVAVYARPERDQLRLTLLFSLDIFLVETGARLLDDLVAVLEAILEHPDDRLSALPLALAPNDGPLPAATPAVTWTEATIADRFSAVSRTFANRPAIDDGNCTWTYAELDRTSAAIAARLARSAPPGLGRVGLLMGPSPWLIAAILGVLRAGYAYVPLEPTHPRDRLLAVLAEAEPFALVADGDRLAAARALAAATGTMAVYAAEALAGSGETGPLPAITADALAYLLFTSGTTGAPKGVMQVHGRILRHVQTYGRSLALVPEDRLSLLASFAFDAAVMDLFGALLHGACLTLPDLRGGDVGQPMRCLAGTTILHVTPTVLRHLLAQWPGDPGISPPRAVVLGGEPALPADIALLRARFGRRVAVVNGLGPTECTLALQYHLPLDSLPDVDSVSDVDFVPVGWPVEGVEVRLVNTDGQEVGPLAVGEIVICSDAIAPGYWRRPDLSARAFFRGPSGRRCYRTGDLGRRRRDGCVEFVRRLDGRMKIRAVAVEAAEVEAHLRHHPTVRTAAVSTFAASPGGAAELAAYIVPSPGAQIEPAVLRAFLRGRLPDAMIPAAFVRLDALPMTANGKLDRGALPLPLTASSSVPDSPGAAAIPPRDPLEAAIAAHWREVLRLGELGVEDDFFDLGGHSLLAMQVVSRIRAELCAAFPLRSFFEAPTIAATAATIGRLNLQTPAEGSPPPRREARERYRIRLGPEA